MKRQNSFIDKIDMPELPILLLPEKKDPEISQVLAVCELKEIAVKRLGKYWIKDEALTDKKIAVYGNQVFSMVVAQIYSLTLISPDDILVTKLPAEWTKRSVRQKQIEQLLPADFPLFIKPVIPKLFTAGIFNSITAFKASIPGISIKEDLLISSIIRNLQAEARAWVIKGEIKDMALYEGEANLAEASEFLTAFLEKYQSQLPAVLVIDLAFSTADGWCILEFNTCWGAGLNNCSAKKIIDCIIAATVNP